MSAKISENNNTRIPVISAPKTIKTFFYEDRFPNEPLAFIFDI